MPETPSILSDLPRYMREVVRFYWQTRTKQREKQAGTGTKDQGLRSAVTGGAQMDAFIELLTKLVIEAGIDRSHIFYRARIPRAARVLPPHQAVGFSGCG